MRTIFFTILAFFLAPNVIADTEPNNTWQTALALPQDRTIAGTQSDDDWYVINAVAGNLILIDLTFAHADGDIELAFYDDGGNISQGFPGTLRANSVTNSDHEFVRNDISGWGPGTFYIQVYGGTGGDQGNSYTLTWTELAGADDGFEENDDNLSPAAITQGAVAFGSQSDPDWYSIDVISGGRRVLVSMRFNAADNLDLELRDAGGTLLAPSANGVGIEETIDYEVATIGTYHINVTGNSSGEYYAFNWAGVGISSTDDFPMLDVNEVPVATANTVSTPENTAYSFAAGDFTFSDTEGDSLVSATITNLSLGGGTLTYNGGTPLNSGDTLTASQLDTLVYTPPANIAGSPLATFDFTVNDVDVGTVAAQMDIDVNSPPVANANTVSTPENTAYSFAVGDFKFSDTEGDSLVSATITSLALGGGTLTYSGGTPLNGGDTLTAAQLDTLVYTPPANITGSPLATFDFTVNDVDVGTVAAQMDIDVTAATTPAPAGGGSSGSISLLWLFAFMLIGVARRLHR